MGHHTKYSPYMFNGNGIKVYSNAGKEGVHRAFWRNNFQITEAENDLFDEEMEEMAH